MSRVFAFIGAKGGVGTTTVAVNAATALAGARKRALLIDLHEGDGDAATFMNVAPARTLTDACANVHRLDGRYLRGVVTPAAPQLDVLAAADRRASGVVDAARVCAVMQRAAASYPYVIVDVSPSHVPMLESIDGLTRLLIVTSQEFVALKGGRRLADGLRSWGRHDRVSAVLNRFDAQAEIGARDVERVLGVNITHAVPNDYPRAASAMGRGRPVVFSEPSALRDAFMGLAACLSGDANATDYAATSRPGWFQRLAHVN